jgi:hypothetical protein
VVSELVLIPYGRVVLALTPVELAEAVERGEGLLPAEAAPQAPQDAQEPALTAEQLEALTNVPASWWAEQARKESVPHFKIGRYVRFRLSEVLAATAYRRRPEQRIAKPLGPRK